ncbi:hypothetical protein [Idiomarina sp.]|uniref:hypothetical protein n=1 Tax=Idiomarina sp. TaxID=1874361 RepID=UPI0025B876FA|nr:hypothetical protein [Idiomarina sp.]
MKQASRQIVADTLQGEIDQQAQALLQQFEQHQSVGQAQQTALASLVDFANQQLLQSAQRFDQLKLKITPPSQQPQKLYRQIKLGARDIVFSPAIYKVEKDGKGREYGWLGKQKHLQLNVAIDRSRARQVKLKLLKTIDSGIAQKLAITADGKQLETAVKKGNFTEITARLARSSSGHYTQLAITLPYTKSPAEVEGSKDKRQLGIALHSIFIW